MVSFIKREIHNLAIGMGFTTSRAGQTDIILAELTSNLIKFAERGEILYRATSFEGLPAIEMYCIDEGIGIENVNKIMNDGFSTSNTLGHGLGAIARLSNVFEIYSVKNKGTVQYIIIGSKYDSKESGKRKPFDYAAVQLNCPKELVCGDGYFVKSLPGGFQVFVGDGLGHGVHARDAVQEAIRAFRVTREHDPVEIIRDIHASVKKTRGLVATIATADYKTGLWNICGVGNISTRIFLGLDSKNYSPYNGIIGHNIPRTLNNTVVPYLKNQMLVMHSDGLKTRWKLSDYPSLLKHPAGLIAATLYSGNVRGNDDATIFVGKVN